VGGHCLPLDPFYLTWKARRYDFHMRFTETAAEINLGMPWFVRDKVRRALNDRGIPIKGAHLFQIGLAYKKNINDWQESPALKVLHLFEQDGAIVDYHDPHVPSMREDDGRLRHSILLREKTLADAACVVITTDHSDIDWDFVARHAALIVDARNATQNVTRNRENIVLL
jgi:UDP-N-acetyl-D-glucosamine dehydrogenase